MKIIKIFISVIDRIVFLIFLSVSYLSTYLFSVLFKRNLSQKSCQNKILFLASGPPIKYPTFFPEASEELYYNMWHKSFQKQFCLPYFARTYVFYGEGDKDEVYRFTSNVIAISKKTFLKTKHFTRTSALISGIYEFIKLSLIIKRTQPRIIYTNVPGNNLFISVFLSSLYKLDLVAQVMGSYDLASFEDSTKLESSSRFIKRNLNKIINSVFFRQASLVLAYNKYCGDFAIHNGAHPGKVRNMRIAPHFYEDEIPPILSKKALEYPTTNKNIILWSRFSEEKKNYFAVKGALEALEHDKSLGFIIIGYGPLYEKMENMVASSGVGDRVYLFKFKPFRELLSYIYHSDIALIPLGGYAMIEAAMMKKPIVCFDLEWHQELITAEESGYLVDYPESDKIKDALLEAIADPDEAKKRALKANSRAKKMFCLKKIKSREHKIIENFLSRNIQEE